MVANDRKPAILGKRGIKCEGTGASITAKRLACGCDQARDPELLGWTNLLLPTLGHGSPIAFPTGRE